MVRLELGLGSDAKRGMDIPCHSLIHSLTLTLTQVQSAALIGFAETLGVTSKWTTEQKNSMCILAPHPETPEDFVNATVQTLKNNVGHSACGRSVGGW